MMILDYLQKVGLIFMKDFKEELKELSNLLSTVIFALMLVFIFSFSLNLVEMQGSAVYPALIWMIILFASTLGMVRSFSKEKENDVLEAVILAAGERSTIFFGKFLANLCLLVAVEALVIPAFFIFLDFQGDVKPLLLIGTLLLGSAGLALVGTFLNTITGQIRGSQILLPILLFPLTIPLLMAVVACTRVAFGGGAGNESMWLFFLAIFDLLFIVLPLILFDYVLEV